jgi:hypothetical protein
MEEARSVLRDAVETAVYAHYMHGDPNLQRIWLSKDDSAQAGKDFTEALRRIRELSCFGVCPCFTNNGGALAKLAHTQPRRPL